LPNPDHKTYRATLINYKLCQFIEKIDKASWKQTGCNNREVDRNVKITKDLQRICETASRAFGMELCGIDLMKSKGQWYVIEANSSPSIAFISKDIPMLARKLVDFLYRECQKP
jgi:glutathione synthase/RimK-type ligase-like ATP-grasp enzyme